MAMRASTQGGAGRPCAVAAFAAALALAAGVAWAAAGDLDGSFSGGGTRVISFGSGEDSGYAVATQANGKIVAAGYTEQGTGEVIAVTRLRSGGSLDPGFSGDGKRTVTVGSGSSSDSGLGATADPAGRIIVAANAEVGAGTNFALVRLKPGGGLDQAFSGDGKRTFAFSGSGFNSASEVAVQGNGKIVVAGSSFQTGGDVDFAVARLNSNGGFDNSFSGDGRRTIRFGAMADFGNAVAVQNDGKIVVAGVSVPGSGFTIALARLRPDGNPDPSFSGDGKRVLSFPGANSSGNAVVIQPNGRIVVAGTVSAGPDENIAVVRFDTDGSLDGSFSGDGRRTLSIGGGDDFGRGVAIQDNGTIVLGGESQQGMSGADFAAARLKSNGSLDTSFSGNGKTTESIGSGYDAGRALALDAQGRIVIAGDTIQAAQKDLAVIRLLG